MSQPSEEECQVLDFVSSYMDGWLAGAIAYRPASLKSLPQAEHLHTSSPMLFLQCLAFQLQLANCSCKAEVPASQRLGRAGSVLIWPTSGPGPSHLLSPQTSALLHCNGCKDAQGLDHLFAPFFFMPAPRLELQRPCSHQLSLKSWMEGTPLVPRTGPWSCRIQSPWVFRTHSRGICIISW